jgi:hypothetical protein
MMLVVPDSDAPRLRIELNKVFDREMTPYVGASWWKSDRFEVSMDRRMRTLSLSFDGTPASLYRTKAWSKVVRLLDKVKWASQTGGTISFDGEPVQSFGFIGRKQSPDTLRPFVSHLGRRIGQPTRTDP